MLRRESRWVVPRYIEWSMVSNRTLCPPGKLGGERLSKLAYCIDVFKFLPQNRGTQVFFVAN